MNPECSYGISTKSSDFSRSRGEWRSVAVAVAVECGDISKAAFSCCYLEKTLLPFLLLSHTALLPSLIPPCHSRRWCCGGMRGRAETIDRASILSGENAPVWQSHRWQRAAQICCILAITKLWWRLTTQGKQGQLQTHVLIWKEQRETHSQNSIPLWVFFWKINLPAETR